MPDLSGALVPLAHVGHYLWILYVLPVLIVVFSIAKTTISEKKAARTKSALKQGAGRDRPDTPVEGVENLETGPLLRGRRGEGAENGPS